MILDKVEELRLLRSGFMEVAFQTRCTWFSPYTPVQTSVSAPSGWTINSISAHCALVSHLHWVDAALRNGTSQRSCHQPLQNAQCLLIAANQPLYLIGSEQIQQMKITKRSAPDYLCCLRFVLNCNLITCKWL